MDSSNPQDEKTGQATLENAKPDTEQYSVAMVDTIFADTLSRGMQNAITSQQNAQMASSTSITNACARILQARATTPITAPINTKNTDTVSATQAPDLDMANLGLAKNQQIQGDFNLASRHELKTQAERSASLPEEHHTQKSDLNEPCCPNSVKTQVTKKKSRTRLALYWAAGLSSASFLASSLYMALV